MNGTHKPFAIPQDERKRLMRSEMNAIIYFRCAIAAAGYCLKDLSKRLDMIPDGTDRLEKAVGEFSAIIEDVLGTVPEESEKRLGNITHDFKIILAPKPQSEPKTLILQCDDANIVMDAALKSCGDCYKTDNEARKACKLYKVLETYCPLDDYGNGMICQYGKSEIE